MFGYISDKWVISGWERDDVEEKVGGEKGPKEVGGATFLYPTTNGGGRGGGYMQNGSSVGICMYTLHTLFFFAPTCMLS